MDKPTGQRRFEMALPYWFKVPVIRILFILDWVVHIRLRRSGVTGTGYRNLLTCEQEQASGVWDGNIFRIDKYKPSKERRNGSRR